MFGKMSLAAQAAEARALALYKGRGLPLLAPAVRLQNLRDEITVELAEKTAAPTNPVKEGVYMLSVSGTTLTVQDIFAGGTTIGSATIAAGGTNDDDALPGVDLTFPNPLVEGTALVAVSSLGDPKIDQRFYKQLVTAGAAASGTITVTPGTDTPWGTRVVLGMLTLDADTTATTRLSNVEITQNSANVVRFNVPTGTATPLANYYNLSVPAVCPMEDGAISILGGWNSDTNTVFAVHGWYE